MGHGQVKIKLEAASVCGTDLHIYNWDAWASSRIKPPTIIGHEFCGTIVEVGEGVLDRAVGDFVSSESHIVCGHCKQCLNGQGHVCVNTKILGVDVDGGFAEYAVIPSQNARPTNRSVPREIAAFQDALGNAVHTAMAGPLKDQVVLITGMGPIGLFAVSVCKAAGAAKVITTEISPYRIDLAHKVGADLVLSPKDGDLCSRIEKEAPGGVDATLEMSGHPSSLELAVQCTRPGGRISLLGLYGNSMQTVDINALIFKGIDLQGIVGRRIWQTWDQMGELLEGGKLNLRPVITHQMHYTEFQRAMELMKAGQAGKVVFTFES
ncbi:putative L-threonine 3-dehydrogenase [Fimbriimonas ginsengisoli Gsoil 348]|uniref:Putative L-threonine 3-dehydrogenase n=1 Tax=Fimbriimonas ginsengisoli Gsoil 348 TaxID=661478 RepID=A0A068NTA1_FIMGI|nr:putative L-threonine 3-dehydrogenase [Fimbriimonas ginsengisoli Gsoil 348]